MASNVPGFIGDKQPKMPSDVPRFDDGCHHGSYYCNMDSKIMLIAVLCLVLVVIIVAMHVHARIARRREATTAPRQPERSIDNQIHTSEPPKRGLDPSIVASLPMFVFKQANPNQEAYYYNTMDKSAIECAVCLSILEEEEKAKFLPNCKHTFHAECIDKWLSSHSTCPICRAEAEPRILQLQPAAGDGAPPQTSQALEGLAVGESSGKAGGLGSRVSSFKRILSRERSSRRIQYSGHEEGVQDLERQ